MDRLAPVPTTVSKSVQAGSVNAFLYCTVYDIPPWLGKDSLKSPLDTAMADARNSGSTTAGPRGPAQLAAAATVRAWQMSMPLAETLLVGMKVTTLLVV
jgi:hypothetical protein